MAVHDGSLLMQVFLFDPAFIWEGPSGWHFLEPFYHFSNRIREVGLYQDLDRIVKEAKGKEEGWQLMVSSLLLVFLAELRRYHKQYQEAGKGRAYELSADSSRTQLYAAASGRAGCLWSSWPRRRRCIPTICVLASKKRWGSPYRNIGSNCGFTGLYASRVTDKPVTEIAIECGFNSLSYFHRTFRRCRGHRRGNIGKSEDCAINGEYWTSMTAGFHAIMLPS